MTISRISSDTIKIILTDSDLRRLGVNFAKLEKDNPDAKKFIDSVIDIVKSTENFKSFITTGKLFVEVFEDLYGGCVIFLTISDEKRKNQQSTEQSAVSQFLYEAKGIDPLLELCREMYSKHGHIIKGSRLYYLNGKYRLVISVPKNAKKNKERLKKSLSLIPTEDELIIGYTKEHYDLLIKSGALKKLNSLDL